MKKQVIVWLKNGMIAQMNAHCLAATTHQVIFPKANMDLPLLVEVEHTGLTTLLDLSGMSDCVVLQFGADRYFTGATYVQNRSEGSFMIQSQAKFLLLMKIPLPYPLEETEEIMIKTLAE